MGGVLHVAPAQGGEGEEGKRFNQAGHGHFALTVSSLDNMLFGLNMFLDKEGVQQHKEEFCGHALGKIRVERVPCYCCVKWAWLGPVKLRTRQKGSEL